jgi:hypothetical protein
MFSYIYTRRLEMNAEQKRAWLAVISCIVCAVFFAALMPFFGVKVAWSAFGVLGANGFSNFIGRRDKADERDVSIARRATALGFGASYLFFVLALFGVWLVVFVLQGESHVSVDVLPMIVFPGFMVAILIRAVAVLVGYARHAEADDV